MNINSGIDLDDGTQIEHFIKIPAKQLIEQCKKLNKDQLTDIIHSLILYIEDTQDKVDTCTEWQREIEQVCNDNLLGHNPEDIDEYCKTSAERYYMLERELEEKEQEISNLESEVLSARYDD